MPIEYTPRTRTDVINVSIRRNQPDLGIFNLDIQRRRKTGHPDSGYHLVVRWDATVEKGRPHDVVGGWLPNAIEINVICKGEEPTEQQTQVINALTEHLTNLYQGASIHYA